MVLGKKETFLIGNGAEMGRKGPELASEKPADQDLHCFPFC